jgi:hypothetical protein
VSVPERFVVDALTLAGVCLALAIPLDARADDLSSADLEAIDRTLAAASASACAEPRDHLRALREAYARQEAPVVRSAIASRVPMVLDTLRFCIETAGAAATTPDVIEPARRALAAARTREECSVPAAGIEQLITAWEGEGSPVVRSAIESRLETLAQTVGFCLETLGPAPTQTAAPSDALVEPTVETAIEPAVIAPLPPRPTGGRALGSPFTPR